MSLIPYQPFFDIEHLLNKMKLSSSDNQSSIFSPKVEVTEKDNEYHVNAEFPGVDKKDISISLDKGILYLEAEMDKSEKKEEEGKVIFQERQYGKFSRSFNVGDQIQESDIKATYKDGVLSLSLPKKEPSKKSASRIAIESA